MTEKTEAPLQLQQALQKAIDPLTAPIKEQQAEIAEQMESLTAELAEVTQQKQEFGLDTNKLKTDFKRYHKLTSRLTEIDIEQSLLAGAMKQAQQDLADAMAPLKQAHPIMRVVSFIEEKMRSHLTFKINGKEIPGISIRQLGAERQSVTTRLSELVTQLEVMGADITGVQATADAIVEAINDDSVSKFLPPNETPRVAANV